LKKIIIYTGIPLQRTWAIRWGINQLINHGFEVVHWDASNIYYDSANKKAFFSGSESYRFVLEKTKVINNLSDLEILAKNTNPTDILWILNRGTSEHKINNDDIKILNNNSINYTIGHLIPWEKIRLSFLNIDKLKKITKYKLKINFFKLLNYHIKPRLIISSGRLGRHQVMSVMPYIENYISVPSIKVLWEMSKRIVDDKYIVYVDESPAFAPDAALLGGRMPIHNIEHFYKKMNNIFNKIENWSSFPIVIAASGKYDYKENPFKNRKIIYRKTLALIQHAEIVIGHKSLALDQAIIEKKPVILLTNDEFPKNKNQQIMENAQFYHNKEAINTENFKKEDYNNCYSIDHDYYKQIEHDYFREEGVTGTFAENMISAFESIN